MIDGLTDTIGNSDALHIVYINVTSKVTHIPSAQCPCDPELIYESNVTGNEIWRHVREV